MGIAFPLTPAPEKQKSSALARSGFFLFPRFFNASVLQMSISFALKISAGIRPRFPSKARLSSGCIGSLPLQNRLAAGRQWRFASFHRGGASPRWRNRMHPVPSNGQNKNDQLSSFDYGWSPLLWPL
jgi:hypothetical protein